MTGYTKLFGSIVDSTIWSESKDTKIIWITMLAKADKFGIVSASIPGLANAARVTVEECETSLKRLLAPDTYSRTKDFDGRRIKEVDGGWFILNHAKYRHKMSQDERRDYLTVKQKEYRERIKNVNTASTNVNTCQPSSTKNTQAEAKAEAKAGKKARKAPLPPISDDEWLKERASAPAYQGIDVPGLWLKMNEWCAVRGFQPTRRRMISWLNREKPMQVNGNGHGSIPTAPTRPIWKIKGDLEAKEKTLLGVRRALGQVINSDNKWEPILTGGEKIRVDKLKDQINQLKLELETAPI